MAFAKTATLLCLIACGQINFERVERVEPMDAGVDASDAWFDPAYGSRQRITFLNRDSETALDDFPALVTLSPDTFDYGAARSDGSDLLFVDADGVTTLAYEVERFIPAGESLVWVAPASIEASDDDFVWLYYGRADGGPIPLPALDVWRADYVAVWHFDDDLIDAAGPHHAVNQGSTSATGRVGDGRSFAPMQHAVVADTPRLAALSDVTISSWVQHRSSQPAWVSIIARATGEGGRNELWLGFFQNQYRATIGTDMAQAGEHVTGDTRPEGEWVWVAVTFGGGTARLYVDGAEIVEAAAPVPGTLGYTGNPFIMGADANMGRAIGASIDWIDAVIDELRISEVARSADWLRAEHASMDGTFTRVGPIERR